MGSQGTRVTHNKTTLNIPNTMNLQLVRQQLAPTGVLRAGINMSNFLLVTGKDAQGDPEGVSPSIARAIADKLSVPVSLISYPGPGALADALAEGAWDIGNIANEKERAKTICFSPAYCDIQATYLVPAGSAIQKIEDVDKPNIRIVAKERSAYDLWLTENIKFATIIRTKSIDESFKVFCEEDYEVLAGLRPKLLEEAEKLPGSMIVPGSFTVIGQSIGCKRGLPEAAAFLHQFVEEAKKTGLVSKLIEKYGVQGKLSTAAP